MSATRLSDLLPIPEGAKDLHAYQVFGLEGGEQDAAKIKRAVASVYAKLKAAKEASDPAIWKRAAKLAKESKAILADPSRRAELDARFGIVPAQPAAPPTGLPPTGLPPAGIPPAAPGMAPTATGVPPTPDPLAGMLPPTNPMAAADSPMAPANSATSPSVPVVPALANVLANAPAPPGQATPAAAPAAAPVAAPTTAPVFKVKKTKRRKKSGAGKILFVFGMCALAAAIAGLGVFMLMGRDIPITKDGKLITDRGGSGVAPAVSPPRPRQQRDSVMGNLGGSSKSPRTATGLPVNQFSPPQDAPAGNNLMPDAGAMSNEPMGPDSVQPDPVQPSPPAMTPDPIPAEPDPMPAMDPASATPDPALPVTPPAESMPMELTDAEVAANDVEIQKVKRLIRDANWDLMRPAAEKLTERMLSEPQKVEAEALFNLADLAMYYRGGLERGLGTLKATQDFEVTEGVRVLVVAVDSKSLTIKHNGRNSSYTIERIPFRLAEKITSFAMDLSQPDGIASKVVYQAISPLSNSEHREASIEWLQMVDEDLADVDASQIAKQIKEIF